MGTIKELEHTTNREKAREVALDHLSEDPRYYSKLKTAMNFDINDYSLETIEDVNTAIDDLDSLLYSIPKGTSLWQTLNDIDTKLHRLLDRFEDIEYADTMDEGFKNTYEIGDRVTSPTFGTGTIIDMVEKGRNKQLHPLIKFDNVNDPDGDTFWLPSTMLTHIEEAAGVGVNAEFNTYPYTPDIKKGTLKKQDSNSVLK